MRTLLAVLIALSSATSDAAVLRDVRLWDGPDSTRVVLDLGTRSNYNVFTLDNPDRVVIDLPRAQRGGKLARTLAPRGVVRGVRTGPHDKGVRVVLDVAAPVTPKSFEMAPGSGYGYRLILDLYPRGADSAAAGNAAPATTDSSTAGAAAPAAAPAPAATPSMSAPAVTAPPAAVPPSRAANLASASSPAALASTSLPPAVTSLREKPIVIAIDPGHGGEDPGAQGPHGIEEKDVTLAIARRLARIVNAQPGMKAVLTRDGDYYVGLRQRTVKARAAQADLFVSIHCNANNDHAMRGTAVYVLSDHGASSEQARWLANHENAADLVGGVDLHDKDDRVAAVLIDISQTATMEASFDLGNRMLDSLGRINSLQKPQVQQAGFMVLKSPDIPSVLVETAYISNPREEALLGSAEYQERLAASLLDGIRGYFSNYRPQQQVASAPQAVPAQERAEPIPVGFASGGRALRAVDFNSPETRRN
jgi:N-acetylmuramoyl-L-alanine amidase